jgi:CheY-like chemotaxis protein
MKILLIENDKTVCNAIIRLHHDHTFIPIHDIDGALNYVAENPAPDFIMLDLRMNGKGRIGLEVYRLARQKWGNIHVACITGCSDEMLDEAEEIAVTDSNFIVYLKPLTNSTLKGIYATAAGLLNGSRPTI